MSSTKHFFPFAVFLICSFGLAQSSLPVGKKSIYNIAETSTTIVVDGFMDEEWQKHLPIEDLKNHYPEDTGIAKKRTVIRVAYDNTNLYVFAQCYDNGNRIVQSLLRDNELAYEQSDSFSIILDPNNKKQNGFLFAVNAGGAEFDANLSISASTTTYSKNWDQKWFSIVKQYKNYWVAELAIPLNSLSFSKTNKQWGINFYRNDQVQNAKYTWTQFARNFNSYGISFLGLLNWEHLPSSKKRVLNLQPYIISSILMDNTVDERNIYDIDLGGDIQVGLTKSLKLDLTINPDFSNADTDQEITNVTRFSVSLPEQRDFFLENADIFTNFGLSDIRPFFSRRIGLQKGKTIPISYGARLTGNVTDNLRIGLMSVQTEKQESFDAQSNIVSAFNFNVFNRSQLKGLFINRQGIGNDSINDYSRNFGLEFNYISKNGIFDQNIRIHRSFTDETAKDNYYYGFSGNYQSRSFWTGWTFDMVGENYFADLGFIPRLENFNAETGEIIRKGFIKFNPYIRYFFYSKNKESKVIWHGPRTWHYLFFDRYLSTNESENNFAYDFKFRNTSSLTLSARRRKVELGFPTSILGRSFDPLPKDAYDFTRASIQYGTDIRNAFTTNYNASYGSFYNGTIFGFELKGNYRLKSWGNFGFSYNLNKINLPQNYGKVNLNLFKINVDLSFTNKLFLTNFVQLNTQSNNFSMFSRLQWRFAPLSDFYIIYNQNSTSDGFELKNRSVILKITYRI